MGMFDEVRVEVPLPWKELNGVTFQTKDLANCLYVFLLRGDGLYWKKSEGELVPWAVEWPIYIYCPGPDTKTPEWFELKVTVKNGKTEIERCDPSKVEIRL